jgi:hypothetical protein
MTDRLTDDDASHAESDDEAASLPTAMDLIKEVDPIFTIYDKVVTVLTSIQRPSRQR